MQNVTDGLEYPWEPSRAKKWLQSSVSKRQRNLFSAIQDIFPSKRQTRKFF